MTCLAPPPRFPVAHALTEEVVEVVSFEVEGPLPPGLAALLAPEERRRAASFLHERDRQRSARARAGLRVLLGACLGVEPGAIAFRLGTRGKPELASDRSGLRFNLSHSGSLAVVALGLGGPVGVDLEQRRAGIDHAGLARSHFTPAEQAAIAGSGVDPLEAFYRCWVAKESYLKARGEGLASRLDAFEVDPAAWSGALRWSTLDEQPSRWRVDQLHVAEGYAAAITCEASVRTIRRWEGLPSAGAPGQKASSTKA